MNLNNYSTMMLSDYLDIKTVIPELNSQNKNEVINELAQNLCTFYPKIKYDSLVEVFLERESLCSTAVDCGIAVPHAKLDGISEIIIGFGRSIEGIDYDSLDGKPTHFFITLVVPLESTDEHIKLISRISKVFKDRELRSMLMQCETDVEIFESIIQEDEKYYNYKV